MQTMSRPLARIRRSALVVVAAAMLCSGVARSASALDVEIRPDLVFGHKDGLAMTLDVLSPKSGANGAAIIYMVSGGWVSRWWASIGIR